MKNGVFWISFQDFVKNFSYVYAANSLIIHGAKTDLKEVGMIALMEAAQILGVHSYKNPHYTMKVEEDDVSVFVLLLQIKDCLSAGISLRVMLLLENEGIGFEIYKNVKNKRIGDKGINFPKPIGLCAGGYQAERQVSLDIILKKGDYFLIPTTFYPEKHLKYVLMVWHKLDKDRKLLTISELKDKS